MKQISFFVHPEYALKVDSPSVENYVSLIKQEVQKADVAILVDSLVRHKKTWYGEQISEMKGMCGFDESFVPANKMLSNSFEMVNTFYPFGHINAASWDSLKSVFEKETDYSVKLHGCFYGNACLFNLALQLWGYLGSQEYWFNWGSGPTIFTNGEDDIRRNQIKNNPVFNSIDIKYGLCFSMESFDDRTNLPDGSLERNLIGPNTLILK